jgi:hypothetical protein
MKQLKILVTAATITILFTFSQCKKKKEELQLPPETTTGAMTFGCKVNGKVFVPQDGNGRPGLYVQYVNLGSGLGGGWFLNIPAVDWQSSPIEGVSITTDSLLLQEGMYYQFNLGKGNAQAFYSKVVEYHKLENDSGSLFIKKFDPMNRILSGTFSFIGTYSATGEKVNVTEGRFDIRY